MEPRILVAANFPSWWKGTKAELDKNERAGFWKWGNTLAFVFVFKWIAMLQHSFYPANHKDSQKAATELIHRWWIWSFEGPGGTVWIFVSFLCCQGGKNILSQKSTHDIQRLHRGTFTSDSDSHQWRIFTKRKCHRPFCVNKQPFPFLNYG